MSDSLDPLIDAIDDAARGFVAVDGSDQEFARYEERLDAASAELKRLRTHCDRLERALQPFAETDECGIGFIVGTDDEHTERCRECQRIVEARAALREADDA